MSLPLYFDHNMPAPIAEGLQRLGIDVLTAFDDGTAEWEDARILKRADDIGRPVVTMDDDFLRLAHEAWESGRSFVGVLYISDANISVGAAVQDLQLIAEAMTIEELDSQVVYVPL
jgi:predicted nuclease of predicted toxin-antitoxin system